jgi:hypothetical protein
MFTQQKGAAGATTNPLKVYSIHALPNGREFVGKIEIGKNNYQLTFTPQSAASVNGKLVLTGVIKVKAPVGRERAANGITATLLATQGSITGPPSMPRQFSASLKPPQSEQSSLLPITDWTGYHGSVAAMYLKLSPLDGRTLGIPADLSAVQLNARLFTQSEIERDLHWLYSALAETIYGASPNEQLTAEYIGALNRLIANM